MKREQWFVKLLSLPLADIRVSRPCNAQIARIYGTVSLQSLSETQLYDGTTLAFHLETHKPGKIRAHIQHIQAWPGFSD